MTRTPNTQQAAAIEAGGVVFVSAGAGTGKTTVLVERFVRAILERGLSIDQVLVITYTERAAGELRSRIRARLEELERPDLARSLDGAWISTIHGFCLRLLKTYPFEAGLDPRFRVLDENGALVLRSEAFDAALTAFCANGDSERTLLLTTYTRAGLRRMLTGVYETLRSAGRALRLDLGERPGLEARVEELREAARCLAAEADATEKNREAAALMLDHLETHTLPERLLDLRDLRAAGERAATYEEARKRVEAAARDELALRDRDLLQELLEAFAAAYRAAKDGESALDFEDLQLLARDLLRDAERVRGKEQWRFRSIMVDEFQDTNALQCELIDLLAGPPVPAGHGPVPGTGTRPEGAEGLQEALDSGATGHVPTTGSDGPVRGVEELFFVGDEFQSIYRFRHADVAVFRERRAGAAEVFALTQNYRSRPEVLSVVNHLFARDFGDEFQRLDAAGRFPDPAFGPAVELLVTDKSAYAESELHWRRGEAKHVARRLKELVDEGEASPGEIVLLFAAGTDAEWYEQELRALGLPTHRGLGRGYFGQQQVVDLLSYLRLLHNRYDDEALVSVLASPLVGVSNDALVLLRRAAPRRPLFTGLERSLPPGLAAEDERLFKAFRQRFDRLAAVAPRLPLEQLCERIVSEHDYDLAVLAQWDGRRRYANLRKLARLARSYEELRGPDVEGFVRFVREQDAAGARETEAVAEEEGGDAIRLLTIHAAKGLEFKVVVVADAGRERASGSRDEILALPDGRFGFRVADPSTGERVPAFDYDAVKEAEKAAEEEERRRLYYVAMTRAIDRLIVSGSIDPERASDASTPIGWVLTRLEASDLAEAGDQPLVLDRDGAQVVVRVDRGAEVAAPMPVAAVAAPEPELEPGQLALFGALEDVGAPPPALHLPELLPIPAPPAQRVRRLSFTSLAEFERCSYRYYVRRIAGLKETDRGVVAPGAPTGLAATEIGDAVHVLLEHVDLREPRLPDDVAGDVRARYPLATDEEVERISSLAAAYCDSALAQRIAALPEPRPERPFAFEHDGVLLHGRLDVLSLAGGDAVVLDYKTNVLDGADPDDVVEHDYTLQRLVYALACLRGGAERVEVVYQFLERPDAPVERAYTRADLPELEAALSAAIARIDAGEFRPRPSEMACSGCPARDVVCAGLRLREPEPAF
jgi:ATP-dependent exoDNAse (exonuclease V) beta subunit